MKYNHIVIPQGVCVLVSKYFSLGKTSLDLIPYWDWQAHQLLPLSTNTSQHQAVNRYWHMKRFALIDLYLYLACFKFNLQGSLISVAIKYATYPAISTWQQLMVQISFQWNPQLPFSLTQAFWAIILSYLYSYCFLFFPPHLLANLIYLQHWTQRLPSLPTVPWSQHSLCNWKHCLLGHPW